MEDCICCSLNLNKYQLNKFLKQRKTKDFVPKRHLWLDVRH